MEGAVTPCNSLSEARGSPIVLLFRPVAMATISVVDRAAHHEPGEDGGVGGA